MQCQFCGEKDERQLFFRTSYSKEEGVKTVELCSKCDWIERFERSRATKIEGRPYKIDALSFKIPTC